MGSHLRWQTLYAIPPDRPSISRLTQPGGRPVFNGGAAWAKVTQEMETDQFTLGEANALVPWLAETFRKLELVRQEHTAVQERLSELQRESSDEAAAAGLTASAEQLSRQIKEETR